MECRHITSSYPTHFNSSGTMLVLCFKIPYCRPRYAKVRSNLTISDFRDLLQRTIRAFKRENVYIEKAFEKVDANAQAIWYTWCFNEWFFVRLGVIGTFFSVATAWLIVSLGIDSALAGFALSFTLQYTDSVVQMLKRYANVFGMNAMERISEYRNMVVEDEQGAVVPASWPSTGRIEIANLVASYAPDLPPVLKGVTCSINGGERIGIVGRTGAGKSSLAQAIFCFVDAQEGSIHIDGIEISTIKLQDLRRRLAIIP